MMKKILFIVLTAFFSLSLAGTANAGYYDFYFESCCTGAFVSFGYYNAQGNPSFLRYDPYSTEIIYPTSSIPSYPYEFRTTSYYPHYYVYSQPVYIYSYSTAVYPADRVFAGYTGLYRLTLTG